MGSPWGRYAGATAEAAAVGFMFPLCIVVGFLAGQWLGRILEWGEVPAYVGATVGVMAAFWNLFEYLKRLERTKGNGN